MPPVGAVTTERARRWPLDAQTQRSSQVLRGQPVCVWISGIARLWLANSNKLNYRAGPLKRVRCQCRERQCDQQVGKGLLQGLCESMGMGSVGATHG